MVMIVVNNKVNNLNATIGLVTVESETLMKDAEAQLLVYLKFIEMPNPEEEIMSLKTSRIGTVARFDNRVNAFYQAKLGTAAELAANNTKFTPSQNALLSRTITLAGEAEELKKRYPALTTGLTNFYSNIKNDSEAPNPLVSKVSGQSVDLVGALTTQRWDQFKVTLGNGLDNLRNTFRTTYVQYNLYD